jgi:hypothetical protein
MGGAGLILPLPAIMEADGFFRLPDRLGVIIPGLALCAATSSTLVADIRAGSKPIPNAAVFLGSRRETGVFESEAISLKEATGIESDVSRREVSPIVLWPLSGDASRIGIATPSETTFVACSPSIGV